jgi:hypothetical protein
MKRFIHVPDMQMSGNGEIPEKALSLAYLSKLQIRHGEIEGPFYGDADSISIIRIPEKLAIDIATPIFAGLLCAIDYTNEFVEFDKTVFCKVLTPKNTEEVCYPILMEKHVVKFRYRTQFEGAYYFSIYLNDKELESGKFEAT